LSGAYNFGSTKAFLQVGEFKNRTAPNPYRVASVGSGAQVGANAVGPTLTQYRVDHNTVSLGYQYNLPQAHRTVCRRYARQARQPVSRPKLFAKHGIDHRF
jgi:hypothetical protein